MSLAWYAMPHRDSTNLSVQVSVREHMLWGQKGDDIAKEKNRALKASLNAELRYDLLFRLCLNQQKTQVEN
jgi:hypothetical protein